MMIGEHLKKVRNSKNLTQKEMAAGIVNRSFYSRVENGSSSITADNLMKILYRHELSMTDFLYNFGNTKPKLGVYQDRITAAYINKDIVTLKEIYINFKYEDIRIKRLLKFLIDELKGKFGAQYLVLGSHWVTEGSQHLYIPENPALKLFHKYTDQTIEAISSGIFSFLAHPDVCMAKNAIWNDDIASCLEAILDACIDNDVAVEINGYGLVKPKVIDKKGKERYQYPVEQFWQMVKSKIDQGKKVKVICNSDAHQPYQVIENAQKARAYAQKLGITPIDSIF